MTYTVSTSTPVPVPADDPREREAWIVRRCIELAAGAQEALRHEAPVVRVAAAILRPRHPVEAARLDEAAARWPADDPDLGREAGRLMREGWIVAFPRFRELLEQGLQEHRDAATLARSVQPR